MNARGLLHFDAHFENILTDGQRLYFADYGLALSSRFDLPEDEATFFDRHRTYDRCYTRTYLVHWLVTALHGDRGEERDGLIRAYAEGEQPTAVPAAAAARQEQICWQRGLQVATVDVSKLRQGWRSSACASPSLRRMPLDLLHVMKQDLLHVTEAQPGYRAQSASAANRA